MCKIIADLQNLENVFRGLLNGKAAKICRDAVVEIEWLQVEAKKAKHRRIMRQTYLYHCMNLIDFINNMHKGVGTCEKTIMRDVDRAKKTLVEKFRRPDSAASYQALASANVSRSQRLVLWVLHAHWSPLSAGDIKVLLRNHVSLFCIRGALRELQDRNPPLVVGQPENDGGHMTQTYRVIDTTDAVMTKAADKINRLQKAMSLIEAVQVDPTGKHGMTPYDAVAYCKHEAAEANDER